MTRLLKYLHPELFETEVAYLEDVTFLKEKIPEIRNLPNKLVEEMYTDYSDMFCASWLICDAERAQDFRLWLL